LSKFFIKNYPVQVVGSIPIVGTRISKRKNISTLLLLYFDGEAIQKFTLLLPSNLKKMAPNLEQLDKWVSISINDINSEINDLMSNN